MIIKLAPPKIFSMIQNYEPQDRPLFAKQLLKIYDRVTVRTELRGLEAAREAFDLTNNPMRQKEREERYGRHRSVSVGDVIEVSGINYFCDSFGWVEI